MTSAVVVGVDIGGTKTAAAVVDAHGAIGDVITLATPSQDGPEAILDVAVQAARQAAGDRPIKAVGIGAAGSVDARTGTIVESTDTLAGWKGARVALGVRSRLGIGRVEVRNDVDAHALGEAWLGAGRGASSLLLVAVGTGVGGAVVLNGQLLRGAHHMGGEVAHIPAPGADGLRCSCGRLGHLEALASGPGMLRRWQQLGGSPCVTSGVEVSRLAASGDTLAQQCLRDSAACLGRALAGLVTVIDPQRVVIGGGAASEGIWWQQLEQSLRDELVEALRDVELVPAQLGASAAIVGAASTVLFKTLRPDAAQIRPSAPQGVLA